MSTPLPSALRIEGLGHKKIGGATILKDVDLDVAPGSIVSVIGPNGAGKTTLFNVISGVARPTEGRIVMDGDDITRKTPFRSGRGGTGAHVSDLDLFHGSACSRTCAPAPRSRSAATIRWCDFRAERMPRQPTPSSN
ncbi:MAG: ATP-binding cassette domain-containing protein [Microbacterium sp.]